MAERSVSHPTSVAEVNACVSTSSGRRNVKKDATCREWLFRHQIGISLTSLSILLVIHNLCPSLRPYTTPLFRLPYFQPAKGVYVQGWDDIYFVISLIVAFTAVRAIAIEWIFGPIARHAGLKRKTAVRFAEQGWLLVYYGGFWSFGMSIWYHSNYWLDFKEIWRDWPSRDISATLKWYCLMQLSFWLQQILVINIEERRKDHYQMLTHHIITSTLLFSAYIYSFYNVANVVLCIMDIVDFLLPAAKMLKYFGFEVACNVAFVIFLATWFVARHVIYLTLCWSIYNNVPAYMAFGCYSGTTGEILTIDETSDSWARLIYPFQNIDGPICMSPRIKWTFLSFLLFLQVLSIIWFTMIIRVAINVVRTGAAEDTRSDDEGESEVDIPGESRPNGVIGAEKANGAAIIPNCPAHGAYREKSVMASGPSQGHQVRIRTGRGRVRLSDQNDRKALLGRIGCDKPS